MDELRIVLLGKQGAGKSASGNTLLHNQSFHTAASSERVTEACSMSKCTLGEQTIKVIDTPGWCDSSLFEADIKQEIIKCINMSSPGPHVFLLVLPIGRFTNEEVNTVMNILKEFGDEVTKYMIVLFTKGDDLEDRPIEDYLKEIHPYLKTIIQICGQRYHVFNNRDKKNHEQVSSLLKKINKMVERNEEKCYTTSMYQKVKDQLMDNRSRQQFRKADTEVQDRKRNLSESEKRSSRNRCDAEGDDGEKKSVLEDTEEQECCNTKMGQQQNSTQNREHEGLKDRKRDLGDKNGNYCSTTILEDKSENRKEQDLWKWNVIEQQKRSQYRENEGLKQSVREEEKDLWDKKDDRYCAMFREEPATKTRTHSCGVDGRRNVENASGERQEIQHLNLVKIPQDKLEGLIKHNHFLARENYKLHIRLRTNKEKLKQMQEKLQHKEHEYEQLKKKEEKFKEKLMQENEEGKRKSVALQKHVVQMEEMLTKQKTTDEKTRTNVIYEMLSKLKNLF